MVYVSAVLTAAGKSDRMGRPKPMLQWQGIPLIEYQIASLKQGGVDEIVVVLGHFADLLTPLLTRLEVRYVVNTEYEHGKTTSIKAGIAAVNPVATDLLLLAVDQPRPAGVVAKIVRSHCSKKALITLPRFGGRGGHPVVFDASLRPELEIVSEEKQGVRDVIKAHTLEINLVQVYDPIIRLDINTVEEYEVARLRYEDLYAR